MFATIRQYRLASGSLEDVMHIVDTDLAERLSQQDGFCGYELMDCGGGMIVSVTTFRDREGCDRSNEIAAQFVRERLADYEIERIGTLDGAVTVSRARQDLLEPAHA
jgi:hypothetical protein